MDKYKEKCFELENMVQKEREKRINQEKLHAQELEELQIRCHKAEEKKLEAEKERISVEENYNKMYGDNINLRNNLEIEKSNHASQLKNKSLLANKLGFQN